MDGGDIVRQSAAWSRGELQIVGPYVGRRPLEESCSLDDDDDDDEEQNV